jgi:hypothetical protein
VSFYEFFGREKNLTLSGRVSMGILGDFWVFLGAVLRKKN